MREMNASSCDALASSVRWDSPALIASLVGLGAIDAMVVGGNCLVIAAVFVSSKLRASVTNLFIASLAVADLLLGLAVLPFSAAWEVFDEVWLFGDAWCSVWLAVDVWMCTASILNLCAISLDRYVAVTRPVSYPSIMSCGRAKMLIAGVWVLSFLICFPPLVGWNDHREDNPGGGGGGSTTAVPSVTAPSVMDAMAAEGSTQSPGIPFEDTVSEEEAAWLEHSAYNHVLLQHHPFRHHNHHHQGLSGSSSSSGERGWPSVSNASAPPLRLLQRAPSVAAAAAAASSLSSSSSGGTEVASSPAATLSPSELIPCPWVCELTNDAGYVVYSALGSFYIPMLVMLFFYWRIYRAAVRTTKAINQGFRTTKGSKVLGVGFGGGSGGGSGGGGGGGGGGNAFAGGGCSRFDEHRLTLRIHRGRGSVMHHGGGSQGNWGGSNNNGCNHSTASGAAASLDGSPPTVHGDGGSRSSSSPRRLVRSRTQDRIRISVTYQTDGSGGGGGGGSGGGGDGGQPIGRRGGSCRSMGGRGTTAAGLAAAASSVAGTALYSVHYAGGSGGASGSSPSGGGRSDYALRREGSSRRSSARFDGSHQHLLRVSSNSSSNSNVTSTAALQRTHSARHRGSSAGETELVVPGREGGSVSPGSSPTTYETMSVSSATAGGDGGSPGSSFGIGSCSMKRRQQQQQQQQQNQQTQQQQHVSRMGKRNIKAQVKRFRMETKAAKTLGIIVGGFIVCWLPFFTMYLVRAFCEDCIPPLVFSVLFWLGYCNSAINPCIYALFSKDFRFAFKRIICRCFCTGRRGCTGGWSEGAAEAGGAFGGGGGSWGSFRRRSNRQNNQQQPLPSGQPPQRRLWKRDKKRNRSPPAWLLASTWARRTSGGVEEGDGCGGNGVGGNSVGDDSEGGGSGAQAGGGARHHNGNVEVIVTSDSR